MASWSQAFRDLDRLRVPVADAPLVPDPRSSVPGGQVVDRPATVRGGFPTSFQPHPTACPFVSPRSGPRRGPCVLSPAQLGLQIRSEARRRRAAQPPKTHPGAVGAPAAPLLSARHQGSRAGAVTTPFRLVISSPLSLRYRHTSVLEPNQALFLFLLSVSVFETLLLQS